MDQGGRKIKKCPPVGTGTKIQFQVRLDLSAPNHKSQIASDLKSRSPNRKNFPQIAVLGSSNRTFKSRDL